MTSRRALVVCIGNELVADDAVGHAVFTRLLQTELPSGVRLEFCGVGGIALLELLHEGDQLMIVVDAVQLGAPAGTLHLFPWGDLPDLGEGTAISAHGIGLKDAIAIGQALFPEKMPHKVLLLGIEGRCFDQLGGAMTPEVAASVQPAVEALQRELNHALQGDQQ